MRSPCLPGGCCPTRWQMRYGLTVCLVSPEPDAGSRNDVWRCNRRRQADRRPAPVAFADGDLYRAVCELARLMGVAPWKRLWQTLRSSCEKQWAMTLPQFAVSHWMGHSIEVSGKHYTNAVHEELFDKAAGQTGAHHISTHECSRTERIERNRLTPTPREGGLTPDCELQAMEPGGVEPPSRDGRQGASTRLVAGLILTASPPATALTKSSPGKV